MIYTAINTPLPSGMYLCEIYDESGHLVLTLTTEAIYTTVAVYRDDEIERRDVDCLTNTHDVMLGFHELIDAMDMPSVLREFARKQLQKESLLSTKKSRRCAKVACDSFAGPSCHSPRVPHLMLY